MGFEATWRPEFHTYMYIWATDLNLNNFKSITFLEKESNLFKNILYIHNYINQYKESTMKYIKHNNIAFFFDDTH